MHSTALKRFTPLALNLAPPRPTVDWGDFGTVRCSDPFFQQTIDRWAAGNPPPQRMRTGLAALMEFDNVAERDPCGLIFHMSRCGSTLLSRLIGTIPNTLVISEPQPLNALLAGMPSRADPTVLSRALRCLVRALGCRRFGECAYVLKLSSWNIRHLELFRLAFPEAKVIFVQRAPVDVMASIYADPPGWLQLRQNPAAAQALFDIPADTVARLDPDQFSAKSLAAMLDAAGTAVDRGALVVDYAELAAAAWSRVAPFLGLQTTAEDLARMQKEARYYSKDTGRRIFTGDPPERHHVTSRLRALARDVVGPAYSKLDQRRCMQLSDLASASPERTRVTG